MTTKFDTALTALQTKVRAQAKALRKNEEEEATKASTRLIESGVFDDDTLATVTKESLVADGFAPGLADWFVSTFGTKTHSAPALPAEIVLKREKEEDPNDLPLADLLAKVDFAKRDRYYACASTKAGGQKCFVFEGAKLLIEPTIALLTKVSQGRRVPASVTVGKEVYYPRTIAQGPIAPEEEWSVNPFFPAEPLSDDDTCDTTSLSMKDVQPVTRSILVLAQTRTFEQPAFTVHDVETRIESFKGDAGVRNAKRYYPKAGSLVAQGTTVPLKRSAKSFRESSASPARRPEVSDDDAEVHPVTPTVRLPSTGASGGQRVLPPNWGPSLYEVLIASGCADSRSTLLCGINQSTTAGLTSASSGAAQIMLDLSGLNFVDINGQVPLRTYLANVLQIKANLPGLSVVKEAIAYIDNAQPKPIVLVVACLSDRKFEEAAVRALRGNPNITVLSSVDCKGGFNTDQWYAAKVQEASCVIAIATSDLVNSEQDMRRIRPAIESRKCIPVYARPFLYDMSEFAPYASMPPHKSGPISSMNNSEGAWTDIARHVAQQVRSS